MKKQCKNCVHESDVGTVWRTKYHGFMVSTCNNEESDSHKVIFMNGRKACPLYENKYGIRDPE